VAAPAGYGKTTAVRAWCASLDAAVAWVTLDAGDNDPVRLWRYVATAVDRVRPGLGRAALQRLGVAGSPVEAALDALMNGIAGLGSELFVVLDDVDAVTSEECLSSIDHALKHLSPNAHVLVVTRADPALRLAPLRAAGALIEVRVAELGFTAAEAHELLVVLGRLELDAERSRPSSSAPRGGRRRSSSRGCGSGPSRIRHGRCTGSGGPIVSWSST
jgi:LuxR family maltose regulon positive regulatory protein